MIENDYICGLTKEQKVRAIAMSLAIVLPNDSSSSRIALYEIIEKSKEIEKYILGIN